jgi:hypothetical protein
MNNLREKMTDLVSEADPNFDSLASKQQLDAAERAHRAGGVIDKSANWEQTASPAERENRRLQSLNKEKKTDTELEKNLGGELVAKYKIEVTFVKNRTLTGLNHVGIQIWESGKRFHGGGDELMFWCKDNREDHDDGCWAPIPGDCIRGEVAICPNCHMAVNSSLLTNMKIGHVYADSLAKELAKIFRSLNSNADIYLKFHKTDIRYIAMERDKGPEVAKRLKGMAIYPLKNIVKDTQHGADLSKRFKAFITA